MYNILVVDDDMQMLELIGQLLSREGYSVQSAYSAEHALELVENDVPDLFMIDAALPQVDGLALCRRLRKYPKTQSQPIIVITGHDSPYDVADALAAGGDDFILKPFAVRELMARLRAHLRRVAKRSDDGEQPHLTFLSDDRSVRVDGEDVNLTQVEYTLLRYLCQHPTRLHSTQELLMNVWDYPADTGDAALVRNHVRNLRRKLETVPERPEIIQSRHGRGYTIRAIVEFEADSMTEFA